ncbi:membrane protein insertion efficiency factor YidD [Alkalibaculum sp. M08DMB]|uniref:Putative membrane protein insertion efficiency factor n=1 Tax=Alkalibaculum sporogenes TaxID=2655001 RepID=A0A6A7K7A6_9FIRM|nr:membrane protein insertion efficiency factor YidD [Alkalibaculum sporogenes]MPW25314.1 membrane protein insertion efficiency factor YidD [Alkalibaculum sporogenes]
MLKKIILFCISLYSKFISPLIPGRCRFYPTCSEYCYKAFDKYGVLKGMKISINRIIKCHPFHPGGYDPLV